MEVQIRKATAADIPALLTPVAQAFAQEPLTIWLLGDGPAGLRRGERSAAVEFEMASHYDLMFTTTGLQGAALWYPPGVRRAFWQELTFIWRFIGIVPLTRNVGAQIKLLSQIERARPKTPYYYLRLLAVAPAWQGRGIGTALLRPILDICDAQGVPAYLETDFEPNLRFYERHGFSVKETIPIPPAGLRMWTMWREAGTSRVKK
jgi:GNAT superfamily N-acetyltransferase